MIPKIIHYCWFTVILQMFPRFVKKVVSFVPRRINKAIEKPLIKLKLNASRKSGKAVVFLLATPLHGNLGDHAIVYAEKRLLEKLGYASNLIEVSNGEYTRRKDWLQRNIIKPDDIILIDGGGNLGTLWENEDDKITDIITRFKENKIFIFPQTCYYSDGCTAKMRLERNISAYRSTKDLTICLRDRASYDIAKANFQETKLIYAPDIVLSVAGAPKCPHKSGVLVCFRSDKEKVVSNDTVEAAKNYLIKKGIPYSETDTLIKKRVTQKNRNHELDKKWREFSRSALVITDRLHAMIFAAITHTPCIALDNESKKVSGSYEWIKTLPYICIAENADDIIKKLPEMLDVDVSESYDYPDIIEREITSW